MKQRKYPTSLFIIGFITNIIFHFFYLFVPALILMIVGTWVRECLYFGLGLLTLDIILSIIEQLQIRKAMISDSDNPNFTDFQNAVMKHGNLMDNMRDFVDSKKEDSENEINSDT